MVRGELFVWACVLHLVGDWILQNGWMVRNKASLGHPAAWVHGGIHAFLLFVVFPWWAAIVVGLLHIILDTRGPLRWWQWVNGQTVEGPWAIPVLIWQDQVMHIMVLGVIVLAM